MKRSVPFVLAVLAVLFALPAAADEPASMAAAPEAPAVAAGETGACAGATGTAAVLLAASQGNLAPALGIPEPSPQHCTDCCPFLFVQQCRQNCPPGCHCVAKCLDCNSHICRCEQICGP
jgi:hypothetical protein